MDICRAGPAGLRPLLLARPLAEEARKLALLFGSTQAKIAQLFGVSEECIRKRRHNHPEFGQAPGRAGCKSVAA